MHGRQDPARAGGRRWLAAAMALAAAMMPACAARGGARQQPPTAGAPASAGTAPQAATPTPPGAPGAPASAGGPPADSSQPAGPAHPAASATPAARPWQIAPPGGLARPVMPDPSLEPPATVTPVLFAYAQGLQRYVCKPKEKAPGTFEWTLKEPQAKLYDVDNHEIGSHSAGPAWQLADGSKVVKKNLIASVRALQSDGVPWLLVEVESSGKGALTGTRFVQRVDTVGGAAPASGCDAAHAGATVDVDYRASYVFYAPRKPS
jgi:hypothetical protein